MISIHMVIIDVTPLYTECVEKIYCIGDLDIIDRFGKQISFSYHVAACVKLPDGTRVVLDPTLESHHSLTPEEWIAKLTPQRPPLAIKSELSFESTYSLSSCSAYIGHRDTHVYVKRKLKRVEQIPLDNHLRRSCAFNMNKFRIHLEIEALETLRA